MSIDNTEVRLFGFRINKTGTIIVAFISLTIIIQFIPHVYYIGQSLVLTIFQSLISELIANIGYLIRTTIALIFPLSIVSLALTIFILCVKLQNFFRSEDIFVKWLSFRLTNASIAPLAILSLVYLIISSFNLYNYFTVLIDFIEYGIIYLIIYHIVQSVAALILIIIDIYTLIVCVKNKKTLL
ncbi:MAG: hypothetical protein ACFE9S_06000 [Candidatus Hermodarchaeota archaeon]